MTGLFGLNGEIAFGEFPLKPGFWLMNGGGFNAGNGGMLFELLALYGLGPDKIGLLIWGKLLGIAGWMIFDFDDLLRLKSGHNFDTNDELCSYLFMFLFVWNSFQWYQRQLTESFIQT